MMKVTKSVKDALASDVFFFFGGGGVAAGERLALA